MVVLVAVMMIVEGVVMLVLVRCPRHPTVQEVQEDLGLLGCCSIQLRYDDDIDDCKEDDNDNIDNSDETDDSHGEDEEE